ncbi:hypothetical protein TPASS_0169 [Treponema pallidum subsp. pallidum SS14]|uniref:Uncharacterized protein TP_0169 n=2 Tax=Treponema pallidum subsp. pallidum TaxID=161 RepID=Y169_TREPA|nr:RecName: Full=Uncharacterized protein TP_0169 [Treponema pallidum subsp. pallidum str. Nichols]AAC65161.1 predicted coding region TP0169 [Treponema pallidum subsp. pallidum str. Nichols]ACD70595.1 hypothetical protein TPASS_0169 [Treponema pallidum subsp. pallidum SS14]
MWSGLFPDLQGTAFFRAWVASARFRVFHGEGA